MTAVFVAVPLLYDVLFAAAWLLAAELFDGLPAARVSRAYARIGAGSITGALLGGVAARAGARRGWTDDGEPEPTLAKGV